MSKAKPSKHRSAGIGPNQKGKTKKSGQSNRKVESSAHLSDSLGEPPVAACCTPHSETILDARAPESEIVPYDENLLERSRTQWQFGDWESLTKLNRETLQHHPDRAKLAILAAAGQLQQGDITLGRVYVRLAQDWGCSKKLISQIMIASTHNTLGRAAAVMGQETRALAHFTDAVAFGSPGSDARLLTQARVTQQFTQLQLKPSKPLTQALADFDSAGSKRRLLNFRTPPSQRTDFGIDKLATINLGNAWAKTTVNTFIFRHHGLLTRDEFQFTAFYADQKTLRIIKRHLSTDVIEVHNLIADYNLREARNGISLGYDRQGFLHLTYDRQGTRLHYRRSLKPAAIDQWSEELPMTGKSQDRVSYPAFILPRQDYPLTLLYRDGTIEKGCARLKTYDEASKVWADHPLAIFSGTDENVWSCTAYWNHPAIGDDGSLHLSFVWSTDSHSDSEGVSNINIGYACSLDNGVTWITSRHRPCKLPITPISAETVFPASPGSNLINQSSMALDCQNRPHIVFYATMIAVFRNTNISGLTAVPGGTRSSRKELAPSIFRGEVQCRLRSADPRSLLTEKQCFCNLPRGFYRQPFRGEKLCPPDYQVLSNQLAKISDEVAGYAEPIIDRSRWAREQILSLQIQNNHQLYDGVDIEPQDSPITLLDMKFY